MVGLRQNGHATMGPGWAGLILPHDEHEVIGFFRRRLKLSIFHSTPGRDIDFGRWVVSQNRDLSSRTRVSEFFRQPYDG